jgi:hypothetical protein
MHISYQSDFRGLSNLIILIKNSLILRYKSVLEHDYLGMLHRHLTTYESIPIDRGYWYNTHNYKIKIVR